MPRQPKPFPADRLELNFSTDGKWVQFHFENTDTNESAFAIVGSDLYAKAIRVSLAKLPITE